MRGEGMEKQEEERNGKEKKGGRQSHGWNRKEKKKALPHSHEYLSSALTYRLS